MPLYIGGEDSGGSQTPSLALDQTTPQTITGGKPIFNAGLSIKDNIDCAKGSDGVLTIGVSGNHSGSLRLLADDTYNPDLTLQAGTYSGEGAGSEGSVSINTHSPFSTSGTIDLNVNWNDGSGSSGMSLSKNDVKIKHLTTNGIVKTTGSNGTLDIDTSTYLTQEADSVVGSKNGIIKADGNGNISAITDSSSNWDTAYSHTQSTSNPHSTTIEQAEISSSITPIADGNYAISSTLGGSVSISKGIITAWSAAS